MAKGAVLFDLDGTLLDTAADFHACLNILRKRHRLPELAFEVIRPHVSNGAGAMIDAAFGQTPLAEDRIALAGEFLDIYESRVADHSQLFPGLGDTLTWLDSTKVPWGIVTNKPVRFTAPLIQALNLSDRCAVVICPDDVRERKPHPEALQLAARRLGIKPAMSVYVGDHQRDIEAGQRAGMTTVAAGWGYVASAAAVHDWHADYTIMESERLQPLLHRLQSTWENAAP